MDVGLMDVGQGEKRPDFFVFQSFRPYSTRPFVLF